MGTSKQPRRYLSAPAELFVNRESNYGWRVPECPWCGGEHTHGAHSLDEDPRLALGHRVSHCATISEHPKPGDETPLAKAAEALNLDFDGYILVDDDPRQTAELMESLEVHEDDVFVGVSLKGAA